MEEMKIARKEGGKGNVERVEEKMEGGEGREGEMEEWMGRIKGLERRWEMRERGESGKSSEEGGNGG